MNGSNVTHIKISTLIRRGRRQSSTDKQEQDVQNNELSDQNLITTSDKLIPNLNFIANNTAIENNNNSSQNAKHSISEKDTKSTKNKEITDNDQQKLNEKLIQTLESREKNIEFSGMSEPTKKSASADNSIIDEEIEEDVGGSSSDNLKDLKKLDIKKRKLFDIDDDVEDDNFKIDDDQLSGGKLIQHFKIDDDKSQKKSKIDSEPISEPKSEHHSLTNQSTANDVSELVEETSDDRKENHTRSLELISNYVNYEKRDYQSLEATISFMELTNPDDQSKANNDEKDHSMEEVIESNQSIDMKIKDDDNLSELNASIDINNESQINRILGETVLTETSEQPSRISMNSVSSSQDDDDMDALKQKILSLKQSPKTAGPHLVRDISFEQTEDQVIAIKQMEKIPGDYSKEILEDITEESEKCSMPVNVPVTGETQNTSNDFDSIVSLNMIQMLEDKVKVLEDVVQNKDICLASLNMQLDAAQRRESYATNGSHPPSGRDSCSLATNSTEYRTLQDDFGNKIFDFYNELTQRDNLIEKLTDSLQQSMQVRENLQQQSEKLTNEVQGLRKQLTETIDAIKKPYWPRDQESNCQRLSEISIDLVSESDEDLERHFLTDNEDKISRNSKERQISSYSSDSGQPPILNDNFDNDNNNGPATISKQIEQFKKYLNTDELRIFFMVQKKFDEYLSEELEKTKMKYDNEIKILADEMENEKHERDIEINRLQQLLTSIKNGSTELMQLRKELDGIHSKEMEDLRLYFEQKCSDLEKQYSEEVFSQQSQRNDNNSDISDHEKLPLDRHRDHIISKEGSPRKKTREELYSSPSHRQMTPTTLSPETEQKSFSISDMKTKEEDPDITVAELKEFYKEKIHEIKLNHDKIVKKLRDKLKCVENKYGDDEFMVEQMDHQIKDLTDQVTEYESKKDKLEIELKASIDKIFVLREIISELETQIETKSINEHVLNEKVKELQNFIGAQSQSSDMLQFEVEKLKNDIGQGYLEKITNLEETLRNTRPSAEQNALLQQFGEQLRDIATTLDQKTKTLESLHQSVASVSCSTSPCEDVSIQVDGGNNINSPIITPQTSPLHGTQNSLPIEDVRKVYEKLSKHTRAEEAAIKRIKDLEMQIGNIRNSYGELQQERDVLQDRMSEQMTRISNLQSKLEEQRRRAEDLQRVGTSDLNIRIHDLQNDLQNLTETLSSRDKQIINLKNHLEQSKSVIDRQETELEMGVQSDRSIVEKLENELKLKIDENKKLKEKIKTDMINKLALPDLMETMLADKNEEIDHLKEQLDTKAKELQGILEINLNPNENNNKSVSNDDKEVNKDREQQLAVDDIGGGSKSGRTLSDIISISEYDEPDVIRRAPLETESPLILPQGPYPEQTMESSKLGIANLTPHRAEDLKLFNSLQPLPTFNNPNFFADPSNPSNLSNSVNSFCPRQINFSEFVNDSKPIESTPKIQEISECVGDNNNIKNKLTKAEEEIEKLTINLNNIENEKNKEIEKLKIDLQNQLKEYENLQSAKLNLQNEIEILKVEINKLLNIEKDLIKKENDFVKLENNFIECKLNLTQLEDNLNDKNKEITTLEEKLSKITEENTRLNENLTEKLNAIQKNENYAKEIENLNKIITEKDEILSKQEKNLLNVKESEKCTLEKVAEYEKKLLDYENIEATLPNLQIELDSVRTELSEKAMLYEKCFLDIQGYQKDLENSQETIKQKDNIINSLSTDSKSLQTVIASIQQKLNDTGNLNDLKSKLATEQKRNLDLEKRNSTLEIELEKLRSQNSESSKPFSLDEIAQQVEKELNYSAQLDSNILKAIESEEENNMEIKTDSEKLIERDLQQQLQTFKEQLESTKLNSQKIQQQLTEEKLQSQDIQQQDAAIIEAMRLRLEESMAKEQQLHQTIDEEREKCDRLSTQISVLQRSEARKSSLLLKSPPESPRKISRSLDFENDLSERLKSEIKLLNAQNEREKERAIDLQRVLEREKSRFETELNERIDYSEKLKREMDKLGREKESAEQEIDHLQERLTLQSQEIESLEGRIATLQEAETRRAQRRDRERNESTQNIIDLQELRKKLSTLELEREHLNKTIHLLRGDIERGAQRETKLAEALGNSNADTSIPEEFLVKMKEMNSLLLENTKENRQMAETVHILIEERKSLQRKCDDLESHLASTNGSGTNISELEERANHLLGRYLRVESHRKALVHQKRYLLISLQSYEDSENKAMALLNGISTPPRIKRNNLFKSAALVIIAIQRMKFIVKRWHTGKRIVSKSVFTITQQKRPSTSNTYNVSATPISLSPPCRDTPLQQNNTMRPLQAPALINECTTSSTTQPQLLPHQQQKQQSLKFDWTRMKN